MPWELRGISIQELDVPLRAPDIRSSISFVKFGDDVVMQAVGSGSIAANSRMPCKCPVDSCHHQIAQLQNYFTAELCFATSFADPLVGPCLFQ